MTEKKREKNKCFVKNIYLFFFFFRSEYLPLKINICYECLPLNFWNEYLIFENWVLNFKNLKV